jgi:hypothetical protein
MAYLPTILPTDGDGRLCLWGANGHNVIEIDKIAPAPENTYVRSIRRVEGNTTVIKMVLKYPDGSGGPSEVFILSLTRMHCGDPRNPFLTQYSDWAPS